MAAIGLLIILSWTGNLDEYSDNYTNSAIVQAGSAYAIARGINATVSVLQTSTINVVVGIGGSITIGEVLDPVNDLIERFSEVMTIALGSLAMQKILLAIAGNKLFSGLLSLLGALSILVVWSGKTKMFPFLLKLFVLLVVVRFSLGIVVLSNSAIDYQFLSGHIEKRSAELGVFKDRINNLQRKKEMTDTERMHIGENIKRDKLKRNRIQATDIPGLEEKLKAISSKLDQEEAKKRSAKKRLFNAYVRYLRVVMPRYVL